MLEVLDIMVLADSELLLFMDTRLVFDTDLLDDFLLFIEAMLVFDSDS